MNRENNGDEKIRIWTRQDKRVLKELEEKGIYRVKEEYIIEKMDTISDYYIRLYDWYVKKAEKIISRPEGVTYPIWVSLTSETMLQPTEDTVILELEVPKKYVIITDSEKWGYVINYWYVPLNTEDERLHNEELKKYGIGNESALYTTDKGNFYPLLKNKIIKSWDRLFDDSLPSSGMSQGTIWEIRKEWVVDVLNR
ncbi:DUF3841 domain-containing protein [Tissierella sp. MSJ-40]|uniref:DUF3841 domain-containing protein n=1 Tax=Tissierella simiarum TaxID=2841534 RepID=A0ABS6E249_9FIRM|nr:DUF3841 domain-containing protein [Tissierella simiarum]MBU5436979.1 DUF3841 domain-containing protein [Tissierella simiarum]